MKTTTVLVIVQIGVLLFLSNKIVAIEKRAPEAEYRGESTSLTRNLSSTQPEGHSSNTGFYLNEDRLRQVIREELSAQYDGKLGLGSQVDPEIVSSAAEEAKIEYQREFVSQQLEYFASVGSISDTDMQKLQADIAKLDDVGRKEMLRKLTRSLNSGRIEGRL